MADEPLSRLQKLVDLSPRERALAEIEVLEALMAGAIKANKYIEAANIFERVRRICQRMER